MAEKNNLTGVALCDISIVKPLISTMRMREGSFGFTIET